MKISLLPAFHENAEFLIIEQKNVNFIFMYDSKHYQIREMEEMVSFVPRERNCQTRQIYFILTDVTIYITVLICQYSTIVGYLFHCKKFNLFIS